MAEVPETLEGWYAMHDFRRFNWPRWKVLPDAERGAVLGEAAEFMRAADLPHDAQLGSSAFYSVLGHKADLLQLHLRPTLAALHALKLEFARTRLADFTEPAYSYLSVTELSLYEAYARGGSQDRDALMQQPFVRRRLFPPIPDATEMPFVCFYPMNKRRGETVNWYAAGMEERRQMMRNHATTGRKYHGRVQQMITGSTGLDDWEWGVTLFAGDPLDIKKLIYEMRFDEVSAKYADFGAFYVGTRLAPEELSAALV
ncbi:MAG TPA: hydrogen peroxide-dependent heme synthase [Chthonomonadaceae bacterium]|nr:hydrogen peroxide-dependent heme synthase [Chthonomonadaceae bacterium]